MGGTRKKNGPFAESVTYFQQVAWLGFLGKEDPVEYGAALQKDKEEEAPLHESPIPLYGWAKNIQRVAEWDKTNWHLARELSEHNPFLFEFLLGCANVEKDAEPIQLKTLQAEREADDEHEKAASGAW